MDLEKAFDRNPREVIRLAMLVSSGMSMYTVQKQL